MKLNLYKKSSLTTISIFFLIITFSIYPQQRPKNSGVNNENRQPVINNPSPGVEQKREANSPQPFQQQKAPEPQQVQRPVVSNPAPRVEQKKQVIDEPPQRNYEPKIIERNTY